jgi:hypothetical protein
MSSNPLIMPRDTSTRLNFVVASDEDATGEWWAQFHSWLLAGGYSQPYVESRMHGLRQMLPESNVRLDLNAQIEQARFTLGQRVDLPGRTKQRYAACLEKLLEFSLFQHGNTRTRTEPALPRRLVELPEWLREPVSSYLRLRQRNWPAHTLQSQTQNLICQLGQVLSFFLAHYPWQDWSQLSLRWVDAYVDQGLQRGLCAGSLNAALRTLQMFCSFFARGRPCGISTHDSIKTVERAASLATSLAG